ncbi:MAG: hypothetical protein ACYTFA_12295 [Planctomycetota bacterium]
MSTKISRMYRAVCAAAVCVSLASAASADTILAETDFGEIPGADVSPFSTEYAAGFASPPSPGQYEVATTAAGFGPFDWGGVDHTTGTGCFMVIDGAYEPPPLQILSYTTPVVGGAEYTLHGWIQNVLSGGNLPPILSFRVDDVGYGVLTPVGAQVWNEFTFTFTPLAHSVVPLLPLMP